MNKPVAWISRLPEGDVYNCAWAEKQNDDDIPLYTHPAELTDEEIMDYVEAFSIDMGNAYEFQSDNVLQMIRAILDKAQEK